MTPDDITVTFSSATPFPPKFVGCWIICGNWGLHIHMKKRPRWLTRKMANWLLEWEWRDA